MRHEITDVDINHEMKESYLQYSMSVIIGRALPDVRDGLKPVHRRILFAMNSLKNTHDKPYKKSARIVGDVIGKYHPHGDMAVYDSIVRMAQDFSMRHPLIDGQGNFGSIDGDSPAAARYTEVRMTKLAEELLEDLEKQTVPFVWNYDDTLQMPGVLPAKYPNLLVNGSEGIAVGMASRIPPHNLSEVISACVALIDNQNIDDHELIKLVPGPDFPTAGIIKKGEGLISAYLTGKGIITVQAKTEIKNEKGKDVILIHELPYQVNKAQLIENIATLVKDKKIEGIADVRDESSREGMRVVIILKRQSNSQVVLNQLFKHTSLRSRVGMIFLALDSKSRPVVFSLKGLLKTFVEHRFLVVTNRTIFDLKKAKARAHILEGLKKALEHIAEVIKIIRGAKDVGEARAGLIKSFDFSKTQANSILEMRLQKLTNLEREKIFLELEKLQKEIVRLNHILSSRGEIYKIIREELLEIQKFYPSPRKSKIEILDEEELSSRDLIPKENILVILTLDGNVKQIDISEYRVQRRGGVGLMGSGEADDRVLETLYINTHTILGVLSTSGRLYWLDAFRIPRVSRVAKGRSIRNFVSLEPDQSVKAIIPIESFAAKDTYLCVLTKKGILKKSSLSLYSKMRKSGAYALTVLEGDQIISACVCSKNDDIMILTKQGRSIRFSEGKVRPVGKVARGVRAMTLRSEDEVIGLHAIKKGSTLSCFTVTKNGYGKRTKLERWSNQNRGGKGVLAHSIDDKTGELVSFRVVGDKDQALVMTNQGQSIRFLCTNVSVIGRSGKGVKLIRLKDGETVESLSLLKGNFVDIPKDPGIPVEADSSS